MENSNAERDLKAALDVIKAVRDACKKRVGNDTRWLDRFEQGMEDGAESFAEDILYLLPAEDKHEQA